MSKKKKRVPRKTKKFMRAYHLAFISSRWESQSKEFWEKQLNTYQFYRAMNSPFIYSARNANILQKLRFKS